MELELLQQQEIPLLSLKRITGKLSFTGVTPSNVEVAEKIAKKIGCKTELVKIKHIYTDYRKQSAKIIATVYNDEKTFTKFLTPKEKAAIAKTKEEAKKPAEGAVE